MNKHTLSKSLFLEGLRCPKLFWLRHHKPAQAKPMDKPTLHLLETGKIVGQYAREVYPGGRMIGVGKFDRLVVDTKNALRLPSPYYYEAAFEAENLRCRVDILCHDSVPKGLDIKEVKMCSRPKPQNIQDIAFQAHCVRQSGYTIDQFYLVHIDNTYVRLGKIEPERLLVEQDVTKAVIPEIPLIPIKVKNLLTIIESWDPPPIQIGAHCNEPGKCQYWDLCHGEIVQDSVYYLPNGTSRVPQLLAAGVTRLSDVPGTVDLTPRQAASVKSAKLRMPIVDVAELQRFLRQLTYPLFYLDFETIAPCLPAFDASSPFEKVPFQYSLHMQMGIEAELKHFQFLPKNKSDPRFPLLKELLENLGKNGTILAWNMSFEWNVLKKLGDRYPEFWKRIIMLQGRFLDLMSPFKSGAYVDYRFCGSASLKKVLPILCPSLSYDNLEIQHGDQSSLNYQLYVEGKISEVDWKRMRPDMLAYCERDTYAMVAIINVLKKLSLIID